MVNIALVTLSRSILFGSGQNPKIWPKNLCRKMNHLYLLLFSRQEGRRSMTLRGERRWGFPQKWLITRGSLHLNVSIFFTFFWTFFSIQLNNWNFFLQRERQLWLFNIWGVTTRGDDGHTLLMWLKQLLFGVEKWSILLKCNVHPAV